jgi:hypothetical protein
MAGIAINTSYHHIIAVLGLFMIGYDKVWIGSGI